MQGSDPGARGDDEGGGGGVSADHSIQLFLSEAVPLTGPSAGVTSEAGTHSLGATNSLAASAMPPSTSPPPPATGQKEPTHSSPLHSPLQPTTAWQPSHTYCMASCPHSALPLKPHSSTHLTHWPPDFAVACRGNGPHLLGLRSSSQPSLMHSPSHGAHWGSVPDTPLRCLRAPPSIPLHCLYLLLMHLSPTKTNY